MSVPKRVRSQLNHCHAVISDQAGEIKKLKAALEEALRMKCDTANCPWVQQGMARAANTNLSKLNDASKPGG